MTTNRWWARSLPVLVFMLFFGISSIFTFAVPIENFQNAAEKKDNSNRIGIGAFGGYKLFPNSQYNGGPAFGATFIFGFSKNIAVELAGIYFKTDVESDPEALSKGKLTTIPLQLSLMWRLPINKKLTPYVLGGGSYFLNSFTLDSIVVDGWNAVGFSLTEKIDNSFGFHFGCGLELALGKSLSAGVDMRYCLTKAKGNWSMKDNKSTNEMKGIFSNLKLNTTMLAVGLKYFFK